MISSLDERVKMINKNIVELKKKSVQAAADKIELMRDLSTYEINMSNNMSLRPTLQKMNEFVKDRMQKLSMRP